MISHLGDSKVFYMRPSTKQSWVTKDHSVVQELFDAGVINSEEEKRVHPMSNKITQVVKASKLLSIDDIKVKSINEVEKGDLILLCTDGALESYYEDELIDHFCNKYITLKSKWEMFAETCKLHSKDNNTYWFPKSVKMK